MLIREQYLSKIREFYNSKLIKILVGIRRCGKSTILRQIIDELRKNGISEDHISYINFENLAFNKLRTKENLYAELEARIKDENIYYFFLDEIQVVEGFAEVVNSLAAVHDNVSIFITGSNSKLLSSELPTNLSGRYISIDINPLSYKEFLELTKQEDRKMEGRVFFDYVKWGGLPGRCEFHTEDSIRTYLQSVYDSIILRDVVERLGVKKPYLFDAILQYAISTIGREFSVDHLFMQIKNMGGKISKDTLYEFLDALCKALILRKAHRYDVSGKAILKSLSKYYVTDLGIGQIKKSNNEFQNYIALENVVYNELVNRKYEVYVGKTPKGEVDFIAKKNGETKYIQVSYVLDNESTIEREFGAYKYVRDHSPKYVLSLDHTDYSRDGIVHLNIIDFLLGNRF